MKIDVIGDEIYVDGERTARIGPDAPWRAKDELIDFLRHPDAIDAWQDDKDEHTKEFEATADEVVELFKTVLERAKAQSPIGLLSIGELSYILNELGKDYGYEADAGE